MYKSEHKKNLNRKVYMDIRLCIYEHFDLIFGLKYKCET
jgi:hypothetical protein